VIEQKPMFALQTGDLVADGKKLSDWQTFLGINRELMRNTPYFPVLGNHERSGGMFFSLFRGSPEDRYKVVKVGDVLLMMLDSEGPGDLKDAAARDRYFADQKAWVEKTLDDNAKVGFIFPYFHKPVMSLMKSRQAEAKRQNELWGDVFEKHGVQVVLQGHDHHYHHALRGGTHYVTCAGGGAPLYDIDAPQPETVKSAKIEHFVVVDVGTDSAKLTAIDIDGNTIDQFEVQRRK
jgi:3',5'-cyclic AMP phosphodiesterase CpdA